MKATVAGGIEAKGLKRREKVRSSLDWLAAVLIVSAGVIVLCA